MPAAKPRYDAYGKPLPVLADAREESLYERAYNGEQRSNIFLELERQYRALLRRGTHAEVTLHFTVHDGWIQAEIQVGVVHKKRYPREE